MTEVFQKLSEVSENPRLAFDSFFTGDSVHPYQASNETKIGKSKEAIQQHESRIKQKAKNRKANKLRKKQRKKS